MITTFHALVLGVVEGITEFLPISSTGHLILATRVLGIASTGFVKSFEIAIQLGAILAVVVLYWRRVWSDRELWRRIAVAFVPTAVIGLAFYKLVKTYLLGSTTVVLWSLLLGGAGLIIFELWHQRRLVHTGDQSLGTISYRQAVVIGLCQALAIIPGVSRAAATIVGGLWLGLKRETVVEFSFLLAIPTMAAATGLDLLKNASSFSYQQSGVLLIGFAAAFLSAFLAIKFLLRFIKTHSFTPFGIYRVALALICYLYIYF